MRTASVRPPHAAGERKAIIVCGGCVYNLRLPGVWVRRREHRYIDRAIDGGAIRKRFVPYNWMKQLCVTSCKHKFSTRNPPKIALEPKMWWGSVCGYIVRGCGCPRCREP